MIKNSFWDEAMGFFWEGMEDDACLGVYDDDGIGFGNVLVNWFP